MAEERSSKDALDVELSASGGSTTLHSISLLYHSAAPRHLMLWKPANTAVDHSLARLHGGNLPW